MADRIDIRPGTGYFATKASDVKMFNLTTEFGYEDENEKGITSLQGRTMRTDNAGGYMQAIGAYYKSVEKYLKPKGVSLTRFNQ